jgi:hypothetical protein
VDWQAALLARARAGHAKTYWELAPQSTSRTYVTLLDVTSLRPQTLTDWDLEASRVQIDVWANTYAEKNTVMEAVLAALIPGGTSNGHIFQRAEVALGPRDVSGERDGTTPIFRKTADLIIHHEPV